MDQDWKRLSNEAYELWWDIISTRRAIGKVRSRELNRIGITYEGSALLSGIMELGESVTPGKLARYLFREHHSTSKIIERMEKRGFVRREQESVGRKIVTIGLTEEGLGILSEAAASGCIDRIMDTISATERRQLRKILTKLRNSALKELGLYYQSD